MNRKDHAIWLRAARSIHRTLGGLLFAFFLVVSFSGLMLAWKKNSGGYLLPPTRQGSSTELADWLPLDSLQAIAQHTIRDSLGHEPSTLIDRLDARPDRGVVKAIFKDHYWEVQIDAATGEVLHLQRRRSDWFEGLHDGSLVDRAFSLRSGVFKLIYSSVMGLSLLGFTVTGFWLWYGPRVMRRARR